MGKERLNGRTLRIGGLVALCVAVASAAGLRTRDVARLESCEADIVALGIQSKETAAAVHRIGRIMVLVADRLDIKPAEYD